MSFAYQIMYRLGVTPWEHRKPPAPLTALVEGPYALPPGDMLDIGCGTGHDAIYCARHGWTVTGVDAVGRALRTARRNASQAGANVRFLHADITSPGVTDLGAGYTLFLDGGCLHGLRDEPLQRAAATLTDAAKPGAVLLMLAFAPRRRAASTLPAFRRSSRTGTSRSAGPPAKSRSAARCATPIPPGTSSSGGDLPRRAARGTQRSWKCGLRFSVKARGPSFASCDRNTSMPSWASILNASASAMPSVSRMVRRIARTATGPFAAMDSAISMALGSASPSGTTWPIRPIARAWAAVMCRPVSSRSAATV